jgi:hypothetical protein
VGIKRHIKERERERGSCWSCGILDAGEQTPP